MLRTIFFFGNKVKCPICGRSFRAFSIYNCPVGKVKVCPYCASFERHRFLWLYFNKADIINKKIKMLHFAPEYCFFINFIDMDNIEYHSVDLNPRMANEKFDIKCIPYQDNSFDIILCNHVLEHVDDDCKAMRELARVLKKDGKTIITVPIDENREKTLEDETIKTPKEREKYYWQWDHLRLYGRDFEKRIYDNGFDVKVIDIINELSDSEINEYGLNENEKIFVCSKRFDK